MNQYLKIPRGINVVRTNDMIIRKAIEEIGKKYNRVLFGTFRSDYAKGKAYLHQKYGISKTALKKLHKIKISTFGNTDIDDRYSNYVSVHILLARGIFETIIKSTKEKDIALLDIASDVGVTKYNSKSKYIDVFFEESLSQMGHALRGKEDFIAFNKSDIAHEELKTLYKELNSITDVIGG